ncbi:apicoplast related protein [Cyclospora cayetanensis]|uniref:Apicoplast related protein n=1 Tax=Cyclospora cayetanensis TaxID=88456 RepID=A0A1D3D078_9EIME|nr:apicoplast related protein [Cyclospora cayetanensis]
MMPQRTAMATKTTVGKAVTQPTRRTATRPLPAAASALATAGIDPRRALPEELPTQQLPVTELSANAVSAAAKKRLRDVAGKPPEIAEDQLAHAEAGVEAFVDREVEGMFQQQMQHQILLLLQAFFSRGSAADTTGAAAASSEEGRGTSAATPEHRLEAAAVAVTQQFNALVQQVPDSNLQLSAAMRQGRLQVNVTCVPDDAPAAASGVLGQHGFVKGIEGLGNLGISCSFSVGFRGMGEHKGEEEKHSLAPSVLAPYLQNRLTRYVEGPAWGLARVQDPVVFSREDLLKAWSSVAVGADCIVLAIQAFALNTNGSPRPFLESVGCPDLSMRNHQIMSGNPL